MSWKRTLTATAGRAAVRGVGAAVTPSPSAVARRITVDPHWRRLEDGHAARLGPRETIAVSRPVGRWRKVDPRRPHHGWRSLARAGGLGLWAGAVGVAWWVGSSRGRGPLASVADLDRFGEALRLPGAGDDGGPDLGSTER